VVEEKRLPNIEVVVVTAAVPEQLFGKSVAGATLTPAHQSIAARAPRGRHLLAERSSHRTIIANDRGLIVDTIHSMIGR
jgi:hypothetical protein